MLAGVNMHNALAVACTCVDLTLQGELLMRCVGGTRDMMRQGGRPAHDSSVGNVAPSPDPVSSGNPASARCSSDASTCVQMKLQQYNYNDGGALMDSVAPKLDAAFDHLHGMAPQIPFSTADIRVRISRGIQRYLVSMTAVLAVTPAASVGVLAAHAFTEFDGARQ